ncbi:hypothetical protein ANN_18472 [Periplaneta americana]|uniref:Uncharacterized protein n=1 Tax=Periplaneta americana TaxID=6978 RepID=A0ABQ8SNU8_PERAM|nr:hypothetical protein ANN_18472 [Periplaneta americana]
MAGLCEGGNEPAGSLKAIWEEKNTPYRLVEEPSSSKNYIHSYSGFWTCFFLYMRIVWRNSASPYDEGWIEQKNSLRHRDLNPASELESGVA